MRKLFLLIFLCGVFVSACNGDRNSGQSGNTNPPVAATAVRPSTNATVPPSVATARPNATANPSVDKGDEIDKLLDELNNALKNMDSLDDLK